MAIMEGLDVHKHQAQSSHPSSQGLSRPPNAVAAQHAAWLAARQKEAAEKRRQAIIHSQNYVDLSQSPSPEKAIVAARPPLPYNHWPPGAAPRASNAVGVPLPLQHGPLTDLAWQNRGHVAPGPFDRPFGSSIVKEKSSHAQGPHTPRGTGYSSYIKPATPGAFRPSNSLSSAFHQPRPQQPLGNPTGYAPLKNNGSKPAAKVSSSQAPVPDDGVPREIFDLDSAKLTAEDYERCDGEADAHMRELLSGAIGEGGNDGIQEGEDQIEGFTSNVRLMPHQVRGVKWMRGREEGRKTGGILADDMGLGKTVQTLARIVEGRHTKAEKKTWRGGTLIVAPLAVNEQWAQEIRTKTTPGLLKVKIHHGPSRTKVGKTLENFDVVITTFQTLASEFNAYDKDGQPNIVETDSDSDDDIPRKKKPAKRKQSAHALFDVMWLRIVLDEAQNIKNHNTKAAKAAVALQAKYRWCLTGTPIQNNVEELYSLFKFLRARPLDDWKTFKRIVALVKDGRTKIAMKKLHVVLKAIMLRRAKDAKIDGKPILNLPGRTIKVVACPFDSEERAFYNALEAQTSLTFNKFLSAGTAMKNMTSVLAMLLRLRQACNHPALVVTRVPEGDPDALNDSRSQSSSRDKTPVKDEADELADMLGGMGVAGGKTCEVCFVKISADATHCDECIEIQRKARSQSADTESGRPPSSAKIRMMLQLLREIEERSQRQEKTIVFSQFTSFLNLVEPFLVESGIRYVRYDGSMPNDQRLESLETIRSSKSVRLILISFKAGSTGLNLTCCNNVILMDLWWNPALEDQAFDRAHRLGQTKDVNIWKLTIEETVENRILALQDSKRELAKAALSGEGAKNLKLTLNDLMKLFKSDVYDRDESSDSDSD